MVMACTYMQMAPSMRDSGSMTGSMAMAWRFGQMVLDTQVSTRLGENLGKEILIGLTPQVTRASSLIMTSMAMAPINGVMVVYSRASGRKIGCTAMVYLLGQMAEHTKVAT